MVNTVLIGHGMVANHLVVGLERIKKGDIPPYGVPLANKDIGVEIEEINIVASYDVDVNKVGKTAYEVAKNVFKDTVPVPETLKDLVISKGVHLNSVEGMPIKTTSIDEEYDTLGDMIEYFVDEWRKHRPDVVVNMLTTEYGKAFNTVEALKAAIDNNEASSFTASQLYAYAAAEYARRVKPVVFVNVIPVFLANDPAFVSLYEGVNSVVLGDDGATGATPLTADILEHLAERNRYVKFIVQFNIGGNLDFLALTIPEKNKMKELTKSSIVEDILGYDAPHYIKPTGYLEPLGDKKFVSLHLEYVNFNGLKDELYVNVRINDSPSLAGMVVDLIRLGKVVIQRGYKGTLYPINAFFMKKPGPIDAKSISKINAYSELLSFLGIK
jgi:myo-inositol-1-phosphate synthase